MALTLAVATVAGGWLIAPAMTSFVAEMASTWCHELGHYGVGAITGKAHGLSVNPDGSGHAVVSSGAPVLVSAAGPLLPVWGGALLVAMGATRVGNAPVLGALAMAIGLTTYLHVEDHKVQAALWGWAVVCAAVAIAPCPPLIRSVTVLVIGLVLLKGGLDGMPYYLTVGYIGGDLARPSDSQTIANALGASVAEVAAGLKLLMLAGCALAAIYTFNWFARHRP